MGGGTNDDANTPKRWQKRLGSLGLAGLLVIVFRWARSSQEAGHDWGDDFSLYLRQAKALAQGYTGQVVSDTRFSVTNSGWTYSPYAYPWAWPMMLMPIVAAFGLDYAKLKLLVTVILLVFLWAFHRLVRRRLGEVAALLLTASIGVNFFFVTWTNAVLSEFPFLVAITAAFLAMDSYQRSGSLWNRSRRPAVMVGLAIALAANIRREAFALPLGLLFAHGIEFFRPVRPNDVSVSRSNVSGWVHFVRDFFRRASIPYLVAGGTILAWQFVMPSDLLPTAESSSWRNIDDGLRWYRGIFAEHSGLKDAGDTPIRLYREGALGNAWGPRVFAVLVACAVVGVVLRMIRAARQDAWLAGSVLGIAYVVLAAPFRDGRYLYAITPWVLYFAAQAFPSVFREVARLLRRSPRKQERVRLFGRFVGWVFLGLLVWSNLPTTRNAVNYHRVYSYVENGPEAPEAKEMFAVVLQETAPTDVILFFRSRAMMLYTDRRAVQNVDIFRMRKIAQWYVMEKGSVYAQTPINPGEEEKYGVVKVWENQRWVLWKFLPLLPGADPRSASLNTVPLNTVPPDTILIEQ